MDNFGLVLIILIISLILYLRSRKRKVINGRQLPPSLPALPIIGSLPFLGGIKQLQITLMRLAGKYGKVFGLYMGAKYIIVLNGHDVIREALVKKSADFAGRGKVIVEGIGFGDTGLGIILIPFGPAQREIHKGVLTVLRSFGYGSRNMEGKIHDEINKLIEHISSHGGKSWAPGRLFGYVTLNIIYSIMYGKSFSYDDEVLDFLVKSCDDMGESANAIYQAFPLLLRLPNVRRKMEKHMRTYTKWLDFLEKKVKENLSENEDEDENFVRMYARLSNGTVSNRELAVMVRDLMVAGAETTAGQINFALILLANNPDVQSKVQKELDSVVPRDRLPRLEDKVHLPYVEAMILELMRIRTAVPLSVPRCTTVDTEVCGYAVPANTQVLVNIWSAHMDPEIWSDPEIFRPERFLDKDNDLINRDLMIAFSLGKRSCLGEVLARQELFLIIAAMVQQFKILPSEGETKIKEEIHFYTTLSPGPYTARLIPRGTSVS